MIVDRFEGNEETFCVIANEETIRVSNIIQLKKYDVVKPSWLLECVDENALRKWRRDDFLAMAPNTEEQMNEEYDRYGDSYTEPIDQDRLKQLMSTMNVDVRDSLVFEGVVVREVILIHRCVRFRVMYKLMSTT